MRLHTTTRKLSVAWLAILAVGCGARPPELPGHRGRLLDPVRVEKRMDASLEDVWAAWTVSEQLERWLAEMANVRPELGGPFELFWEPDRPDRNSTRGCRVVEIEPRKLLAFTWLGPAKFASFMNVGDPPPTQVRVHFQEHVGGTLVQLEHVGWQRGSQWEQARAWSEGNWTGSLERLARLLERRDSGI